jgi:hypothetical protein
MGLKVVKTRAKGKQRKAETEEDPMAVENGGEDRCRVLCPGKF